MNKELIKSYVSTIETDLTDLELSVLVTNLSRAQVNRISNALTERDALQTKINQLEADNAALKIGVKEQRDLINKKDYQLKIQDNNFLLLRSELDREREKNANHVVKQVIYNDVDSFVKINQLELTISKLSEKLAEIKSIARSMDTGTNFESSGIVNKEGGEFIVLTEAGIIHQMQKESPSSIFYDVPAIQEGACASCNQCPYMRLNTLEKLYMCMVNQSPQINISDELRLLAKKPLDRMLQMSPPKK